MRLPARDVVASAFVGLAVVIYLAWLFEFTFGVLDVWTVTVAVLALGIAASVSAVVPGFDALLHGSRPYLVVASVLGAVALVAGLWAMYAVDPLPLAVLMIATIVLWAVATVRHTQTTALTAG